MLDVQQTTLRDRLRQETAEHHACLDALFSTLDLTEPHALGRFLGAHYAGFAAMLAAMPTRHGLVGPEMLSEMVSALETDLAVLGIKPTTLGLATINAHALDHIVLGSRLGTAVLKREWSAAKHPIVRNAAHYFRLPGRAEIWRAHTDDLKALIPFGPEADQIIDDTRRLYRLFEEAFHFVK